MVEREHLQWHMFFLYTHGRVCSSLIADTASVVLIVLHLILQCTHFMPSVRLCITQSDVTVRKIVLNRLVPPGQAYTPTDMLADVHVPVIRQRFRFAHSCLHWAIKTASGIRVQLHIAWNVLAVLRFRKGMQTEWKNRSAVYIRVQYTKGQLTSDNFTSKQQM